jgi:16S rRNA processing protein RimM
MRLSGEIEMLAVEVNSQQRLVPMVDSIITEVDIPGRRVRIDPPEGLLDL